MAHPIIGDTTYGDRRHNRLFAQQLDSHRLLLAATSLQLTHPITGERLTIATGLGQAFERVIENLNEVQV